MEGKTGHHFRQLKWEFIWTVLTRDTPDGFNRRYFVAHMLKTMAGHYNLSYIELLSYFCIEPGHRLFSREIQTILQTLYQEEIRQLIRLAGPFISAGSQHPLLLTHLQINVLSQATGNPADPTWIMEFLEFLNTCKQAGILPHISASAFRTVVWQQTLSLLFLPGPNRKSIHKSRFIKQLMEQLAQQYQVSLPMLIKEIQQKTRHLKKIPSEIQSLDSPNKAGTPPVSPPASETIRTSSKATPVDAIPEYLQFLTACKQAGLLPHIATARFQAAVWQEAIQLLNTPVHRNKWDKTLFLNQLLEQLADHYQLSWTGLINSIRQHLPPTGHIPVEIQRLLIQHLPGETLPIESPASFRFLGSVPRQIEVNNAGVVLLSPWFPRLYTLLGLTEEHIFKNEEAQKKAIFLIQYAAFNQTGVPEHELILNKILAGLKTGLPVPESWPLTQKEQETIRSMLEAARNNWPRLKNSGIEALRETFLQREGMLEIKDDCFLLTVKEKAFDLLLDDLPWNFRMIKNTWMEKRIEVKWR